MSLQRNEEQALFDLKTELEKEYELLDYRLYGSKAKGVDEPGSDIDVMIELAEATPEIEMDVAVLIFEINLAHDCFISAVIFSQNELEKGPMDQSPLYKAIQKDGIAL